MTMTKRKITPSFWFSIIIFIVFNGAFLAFDLLKPVAQDQFVIIDDIAQAIGWFIAALLCLIGLEKRNWHQAAWRTNISKIQIRRWVPLLFAMANLCECIGQVIYTYDDIHHWTPFPSLADAGYLSSIPFLLLGILLLPSKRLSHTTRSRVAVDSLMLLTAIVTFSWYFVLGPTLLQGNETVFAKLVGTAYPFFDLIFIFCVLLLSARSIDYTLRPAVSLLSCALVIIVLVDSIYDYQTLQSIYTNGWLDVGWPVGYMLIGLAVQAMHWYQKAEPALETSVQTKIPRRGILAGIPSLGHNLLPYVLVPSGILLAFYVWHIGGQGIQAEGVYIGGIVLIALVLLRQVLAIRETMHHNNALQAMQEELRVKNSALSEANTRLASLATTDPLTSLPNHRALLEMLDKEFERARRFGRPLSLVFFDGDRFKRVNDTYGHAIGDVVLRELGERVGSVLRGGDTLGRYGGEEFLVLLPETDTEQASNVAERMRVAVAAFPLASAQVEAGINSTISIGIATYPTDGTSSNEILEKADQAMYWAKRLGRNQVRTVAEARQASMDVNLAPTIHSLERRDEAPDTEYADHLPRADQLGIVHSLMWLIELRDHELSTHAYDVSDLAIAIAQQMGLDQKTVFAVATAGLLHDIGKIAIPDGLLQKPGHLSLKEWELIKQHSERGSQILEISPYLRDLMPVIRHHHERWDGNGYPDGLQGQAIPLEARIITIAEAYQAMISNHPYQAARSSSAAIAELQRCAGTHFDPEVVQAAASVLDNWQEKFRTHEIAKAG